MSLITNYSTAIKVYSHVNLSDLNPVCYTELLKQSYFCNNRYGWIAVIHEGFSKTGHTGKTHGLGVAIDVHFEKDGKVVPLFDQFISAIRFDWNGLGLYPFWNSPGLHLDMRKEGQFDEAALWWRDENGEYRAINTESIVKMFHRK